MKQTLSNYLTACNSQPFYIPNTHVVSAQKSISNRGLLSGATWGLLWVTWKILLWIHSRKPGVNLESKDNPGLVWVNFLLG